MQTTSAVPDSNAAANPGTIGLLTWLGAGLRMAPELPILVPGLLRLAFLRPHQTGSIGLTFERQTARHPGRPALRFEDRVWTYQELNAWANQLAHSLKQAGVRTGDAVGLLMENRAEVLHAPALKIAPVQEDLSLIEDTRAIIARIMPAALHNMAIAQHRD